MPFYYDLDKPHDNGFLRFARKITKPLGFYRSYNFPLWVIFGGAMLGFGAARVQYLDINGIFANAKKINGDWEHWQSGHEHIGIILHLAGVIPICFLVPWQFLPIIRHSAMWLHRGNGYICTLLLLMGNAGAFMIARRAVGGGINGQVLFGFLGIYTTVTTLLAYINVKRLQIDQHRAWMLRAWFMAATIITQRLIMMPMGQIMSSMGDYYSPMPCHTLDYITSNYGGSQVMRYPECRADPVNGIASVKVDQYSTTNPAEIGVTVNESFAPAGIIALVLHLIGIELYLALTTAERDRLKQVSYEKQVARGMRRPGDSSYLTANVWGDLPAWEPQMARKESEIPTSDSDV
ncbi:hypothetical protein PRZ48_013681 [Zasmidium cellare]|uniref:Microtubule associated protein n=1 Tax=Zasmidium cellare TaxID=395010 RepID=A0ABR0E1S3_ZASCE|nr:hypothetical protein PRZ48_013681 [Zasmidium cellare]